MRVRGFTTGVVRPKARARGARRYLPGGWSERTMPVNAFLIEHPDGLCLFDAGQTAQTTRAGYLPRWHPFLRLARFELSAMDEAPAQLRRLGHDPSEVRWLVLSHLHTDHVGGVDAFASAEVLVSRVEWERATGVRGRLRGYLPQHWPAGLAPRLVDFTGPPVGPFSGSFDLASDGRLLLVPTGGHTPGHAAMLIRGEPGYLCAGDLVHEAADLPGAFPAVDAFCRAEGLRVLATHDPRALRGPGGGDR